MEISGIVKKLELEDDGRSTAIIIGPEYAYISVANQDEFKIGQKVKVEITPEENHA